MAITFSVCKEKSLFVFRELDIRFITGGKVRQVLGGVIVIFFILISLIISGGFFMSYSLHNSQVTTSETKNPFMNRDMTTTYLFNVTLYTSRFVDPLDFPEETIGSTRRMKQLPLLDLCEKGKIKHSTDRYFSMIPGKHTKFNCNRKLLSNGTEEYNFSLLVKHIEDAAAEFAYARFNIETDYSQVFHFIKWEYWNIWDFYERIPTAYSKVSGILTPDRITKINHNVTSAFRGPESTKLFFELVPTYYSSEIDGQNYEGYQIYVDEYRRGSTVNKRNMGNRVLPSGENSGGLEIEMVSSVGDKKQVVQVHRIRSIIEIVAYIFGFLAGLVIVAHALKYFLSKEEYFKSIERE